MIPPTSPTYELRRLATLDVDDMAQVDALLEKVPGLVAAIVDRWQKHADAGGDPRFQRRHMGELAVRFLNEFPLVVASRLKHLLGAQDSPFAPTVPPGRELRAVAAHDRFVIDQLCLQVDTENQQRRSA